MGRKQELKFDEIGYWSEVKLEIIKKYAETYTTILSKQKNPSFIYIYIDAFSGAGQHISKKSGEFIPGSPLNALKIKNQFHECHFIDLNKSKAAELERVTKQRKDVFVYNANCNEILTKIIFPRAEFRKYRRALCILDPYGLHLNWEIIETAGKMKSVEIFLNFPVMDINMNVLKHNQEKVDKFHIDRMNAFWGDNSWRDIAYKESGQTGFFFDEPDIKVTNEELEERFRERLKKVAGFEYVPEPMPMRNSKNAVVYYLYFASQKPVAAGVVKDIFEKYKGRREI